MSDALAARIRTAWPILLGHIAALLVAVVLRYTGVHLDNALVLEVVGAVLSYAVWHLGSWLEHRPNPVAAAIGRWLVSAGKTIGSPTYGQNGAAPQSTPDSPLR